MEVYRHQVGGHSRLMKPSGSSKVYKPFSDNEYRFYEKLSSLGATATDSGPLHVIKQFVPRYFGVNEIQIQSISLPPASFAGKTSDSNRAQRGIHNWDPIVTNGSVIRETVTDFQNSLDSSYVRFCFVPGSLFVVGQSVGSKIWF